MNAIILEAMQRIADKNAEANLIQQDRMVKLIKDLLDDFNEQKSKKKGFPPNQKSKLKELIKEEAKKQLKDQFSDQLLQKKFLKSEGLKKLLESHTIYKNKEKKIKAAVKDSTIKRWLSEANVELLAKQGQREKQHE